MLDPLIRKLEHFEPITHEARAALEGASFRVQEYTRHDEIIRQGDTVSESCLILEGVAGRFKALSNGKRQILSFELPGDFADLHSLYLKTMDHGLEALSHCRVAMFPHRVVEKLMDEHPSLDRALSHDMAADAAIQREWMVSMGRRSAYQQTAHLVCELFARLSMVDRAEENGFELPVTQADLGDAFGISTVHVNRMLQQLRREGLIILKGGTLNIVDPEGLKAAAQFDPHYLYGARRA